MLCSECPANNEGTYLYGQRPSFEGGWFRPGKTSWGLTTGGTSPLSISDLDFQLSPWQSCVSSTLSALYADHICLRWLSFHQTGERPFQVAPPRPPSVAQVEFPGSLPVLTGHDRQQTQKSGQPGHGDSDVSNSHASPSRTSSRPSPSIERIEATERATCRPQPEDLCPDASHTSLLRSETAPSQCHLPRVAHAHPA